MPDRAERASARRREHRSGQLEGHARTRRVAGDVRPLDADLAHERVAVRRLPREAHGTFHAAAGSVADAVVAEQPISLERRLVHERREEVGTDARRGSARRALQRHATRTRARRPLPALAPSGAPCEAKVPGSARARRPVSRQASAGRLGPAVAGQPNHQLDRLLVGQTLFPGERAPGVEAERERDGGTQQRPPPAADAPPG